MKLLNGLLIKIYNAVIASRWINTKKFRKMRSILLHNICYACEASFGRLNSERYFYVIRCPQDSMGLFAVINYVVYHLGIADKKGLEPVVDWQHYPNKYFTQDEDSGRLNIWEAFFEQTTKISLEEVYKSKNVILSSGDWETSAFSEFDNCERLKRSHFIYTKYIKLNASLQNALDEERKRIDFENNVVLSVKCRGTDFVTTAPSDHAKVLNVDRTIEVINEKIVEWKIKPTRIYLATEDGDVLERMKKFYGEKLYYSAGETYSARQVGKQWLGDYYEDHNVDKIGEMRNYLISTYILASSEYVIMPKVGGSLGALRIAGQFKGCCIV